MASNIVQHCDSNLINCNLFFVALKSVYQSDSAGETETELVGGVSAKSIVKALGEDDRYKIRIEAEKSNVLIAYAAVRGKQCL